MPYPFKILGTRFMFTPTKTGDWVYLCFKYYIRYSNTPSPVTQYSLFLSLPHIPNILRASFPELHEVLRYTYFYLSQYCAPH